MITAITEEQGTAQATAADGTPKRARKATGGARCANVAPSKTKSAKRASPPKKGAKAPQKAGRAKVGKAREGSKTAEVLDLLKRAGGVTLKELMKATGWQPHSVRGFLSGAVGKKMGLKVTSTKAEDGERTYSVKA
jgi:hypothetical protein